MSKELLYIADGNPFREEKNVPLKIIYKDHIYKPTNPVLDCNGCGLHNECIDEYFTICRVRMDYAVVYLNALKLVE